MKKISTKNFKGKSALALLLALSLSSQARSFDFAGNIDAIATSERSTSAEKHDITGVIKDSDGYPVIGATVIVQGTTKGAVTDAEGKFNISIESSDPTLFDINCMGYIPQTIDIAQLSDILEIIMEQDNIAINEVVVVGYGTQKKVNLSGSVDQVNAKQLEKRPMTDISKGLQGLVPNLNIDFTSGEPGKEANINIRGTASINGGSPLILIDGVASDAAEMNRLLPEDIETISVLKDAAAAAIYGARASFGVILITTKTGKSDRITVSYNNNFTWKRPTQLTEKTSDPYIYLKLKNTAVLNTPWSSGHVTDDERLEWARQRSDDPEGTESIRLNPLDQTQWDYMGNTDWTSYYLDQYTYSTSHQLSLSGRSEKTSYYFSAGTSSEDGAFSSIVENDKYNRYNLRGKMDYKVYDWLTVTNNMSFVSTVRSNPSYYNIDEFYDLEPHNVPMNTDGTWANTELGETLAQMTDGGEEKTVYDKFQNIFGLQAGFFDDALKLNANLTVAKGVQDYSWYTTKYSIGYGPDDIREFGTNSAYRSYASDLYNVIDVFATYNKDFGKHNFGAILGYNQEYSRWSQFTAQRDGLISTSLPSIGLASGEQTVDEEYEDWAIRGMFYRLSYNYDDRYIFELNGRYDGTSRFDTYNRFGFFPSGSAAWRIDSEEFFEPLRNTFSLFKIRGSYGSLGNQQVGAYDYIPYMTTSTGSYMIDGSLQQTVSAPGLVSSDYTWEQVQTINGGIDIGLFSNRLTATADVYRRDTKGMLTQGQELPSVLGNDEPQENAADMKTIGWELSLSYRNNFQLSNNTFNYGATFVLSDNRSWITKFDNASKYLNQYYVGQELGEIWGLQSDGFFQNQAEIDALDESQIIPWGALTIVDGWPKFKDLDGDSAITKGTTVDDSGDLSIIGNSSSRYRFGLNLTADWKGFDFSAFLQGVAKRDVYPSSFLYWSFYQQPYSGGQIHAFDFYRAEDDSAPDMAKHSQAYINAGLASQNLDAKYPVLQAWLADKNLGTGLDAMGLALPCTEYMINGAYLRVKNITLGYTLPNTLTNKYNVSKLRVFFSVDNLCEWSELTKYGYDPESLTDTDSYGYVYPFNRQISCGLNITF
ncbi:MAG: TonB-dependent receptor [Rikenellaceae bacterium]